jgi:hypothetical protein
MQERSSQRYVKKLCGFLTKTHIKVLKKNGVLNNKVRANGNKIIKSFP